MADDPRHELERACRAQGEDFATLSRLIGRNPTYIQQFVRRGTPRRLAEEDRRKIALYLGIDEARLGGRASGAAADLWTLERHGSLAAPPGPALRLALPRAALARLSASAPGQLFLHQVEGDSMIPTLHPGDELIVDAGDTRARLRDGIYLLCHAGLGQVRRLTVDPAGRRVRVTTDNPAAADWADCDPDAIECLGRVVWAGRHVP